MHAYRLEIVYTLSSFAISKRYEINYIKECKEAICSVKFSSLLT
jgi:hypothetical protein